MLRGLYIAGSGMTERAANLEIVANNIANLQTDTFKRDRVAYSEFKKMFLNKYQDSEKTQPVGNLSLGSIVSTGKFTDFTQGTIVATGNENDVAIEGRGFAKVELPDGSTRYTRDISWRITSDGDLTDSRGFFILDENDNHIVVDEPDKILISSDGKVLAGKKEMGRIALYEFDDRSILVKEGSSLYRVDANQKDAAREAENTFLRQGYLEKANFSPLSVVSDMITILRDYESSQKVVQVYDETIDQAVTKIGRTQ